jgi:hypothetical protein
VCRAVLRTRYSFSFRGCVSCGPRNVGLAVTRVLLINSQVQRPTLPHLHRTAASSSAVSPSILHRNVHISVADLWHILMRVRRCDVSVAMWHIERVLLFMSVAMWHIERVLPFMSVAMWHIERVLLFMSVAMWHRTCVAIYAGSYVAHRTCVALYADSYVAHRTCVAIYAGSYVAHRTCVAVV